MAEYGTALRIREFRSVWVRQRVDYQQAAERLSAAVQVAEAARRRRVLSTDGNLPRRAEQYLVQALQHLDETRTTLETQFDRFCGLTR